MSQLTSTDSPKLESRSPWHSNLSLTSALLIAITTALVIVAVAYGLYWNDSNRKYDLARPGQKEENKALSVEDIEADTTSPVDADAANQKADYLKSELQALESLGQFNPDDLSDAAIQLAPTNQPSL